MTIRFKCNACGESLTAPDSAAGGSLECDTCGAPVRIPTGPPQRGPAPVLPERVERHQSAGDDASDHFETDPDDPRTAGLRSAIPTSGHAAALPDGADAASDAAGTPPPPAKPRRPASDSGGFSLGMSRPLDQEEMDLTPMVDMTFLLLIFFMITASFSIQKSMEVPPPSSDKKGATQTIQSIDDLADSSIAVRIDDKNAIFIDDEPLPPSQRLSDALKQRFSAQKNELLLTADDAALHDTVVAVIDAANEIGVQKIRMTASPRD
ncbi:MAG: biopolymer transporter ExbD [Planctomycetaceae bacterium]